MSPWHYTHQKTTKECQSPTKKNRNTQQRTKKTKKIVLVEVPRLLCGFFRGPESLRKPHSHQKKPKHPKKEPKKNPELRLTNKNQKIVLVEVPRLLCGFFRGPGSAETTFTSKKNPSRVRSQSEFCRNPKTKKTQKKKRVRSQSEFCSKPKTTKTKKQKESKISVLIL